MIEEIRIIQRQKYDDYTSYRYLFKRKGEKEEFLAYFHVSERLIQLERDYYMAETKGIGHFEIEELKNIAQWILSLNEFRLRNVTSSYKIGWI